jgi:hypothetical protein
LCASFALIARSIIVERPNITLLRSTFSSPFLLAFFVTSAPTSSSLDMSILRRLLLRLYNGFSFNCGTSDKLANDQADVRWSVLIRIRQGSRTNRLLSV